MIVTDTIKRYVIAAVVVVMIVLMIVCGILYKRTAMLKSDNAELSAQIISLTHANESLQTEIITRKSVDQIANTITTQLSQLTTTIDQTSRKTQSEVRHALKNQPCANTELPADIQRLLNHRRAN